MTNLPEAPLAHPACQRTPAHHAWSTPASSMLCPLTRGHGTGCHMHTDASIQLGGGSNTGPIQGPSPSLAAPTNCSSFIACAHGDNSNRYTTTTVGHVFSTWALAQCFRTPPQQQPCHPSGIHSCIIPTAPAWTSHALALVDLTTPLSTTRKAPAG